MKKTGFKIPTLLLAVFLFAGSCQTFKDHKQARLKLNERKNQDVTLEEEPQMEIHFFSTMRRPHASAVAQFSKCLFITVVLPLMMALTLWRI